MFDLVVSLYHKSTKFSSGARDILLAMIGYLVGTVHTVTEKDLLLLTGGVGYRILAPLPILLAQKEGEPVSLYIHTHVREDAITLYGFATDIELELLNDSSQFQVLAQSLRLRCFQFTPPHLSQKQ
jgi:hypothetical protein